MWKKFIEEKPKKNGWYSCTVEVKGQQRYVMNLYLYPEKNKFIDNIRESVCYTHRVVSHSGERIYDIGQDRTGDVIAWAELPSPYMIGFIFEIERLIL